MFVLPLPASTIYRGPAPSAAQQRRTHMLHWQPAWLTLATQQLCQLSGYDYNHTRQCWLGRAQAPHPANLSQNSGMARAPVWTHLHLCHEQWLSLLLLSVAPSLMGMHEEGQRRSLLPLSMPCTRCRPNSRSCTHLCWPLHGGLGRRQGYHPDPTPQRPAELTSYGVG